MSIANNHEFKLKSDFDPAGDQPKAINDLIEGINKKEKDQVLMGVTGSGKTFTMAHVIKTLNKPTLIMAPNKTCLLYTSPSPRDGTSSRMPSSA